MKQAHFNQLMTAKVLERQDDRRPADSAGGLISIPLDYAASKLRVVKTIAMVFGYNSSAAHLVNDINAIRQPGESLGDAAYQVGKLLCEGYSLKDILAGSPQATPRPSQVAVTAPQGPVNPDPTSPPARGISMLDDMALRQFAKIRKIILILRDSNMYAMRWIGYPGAVPKPVSLKAKTLKPPADLSTLSARERAEEAKLEPYYGLASARGLSVPERKAITDLNYVILGGCNGEIITRRDGGYIYSDMDVHGIYDQNGNWAGSNAAFQSLNGTTSEQFFQHGAQDDFVDRNKAHGQSFGPRPPVTAYTECGVVHLSTMEEMKAFYEAHNIDWKAIYPKALAEYRAKSEKP